MGQIHQKVVPLPANLICMKRYLPLVIFVLLFVVHFPVFSQSALPFFNNKPTNVRSWQAGRHSSLPEYIAFTNNANLPLAALPKWLRYQFQLDEDFGLQLLEQQSDVLGMEHYRYQQTYQGHPIEGAIYLAHTQQQQIVSLNGVLVRNIPNAVSPELTTDLALQKALNNIGAQHYRWQSPVQEAALQREQRNPAATYYPTGTLVFCSLTNSTTVNYRLCYKFDIYADQPLQRYYVFVDARTGEIVQKQSRLCHTDTPATAITKYSGTRQITTDNIGTTYRLREAGRGNGIETYNCQQQTDFINTDFTDTDNYWNNVNAALDEAATDAHWGAEMTYDFYLSTHNRQGIDNNNMPIISYVHYGSNYFNAFWDGDRMAYGDGSGSAGPLTALDIAGHEITHGVTQFSAGLNYINESGALNEAFSDIFGTVIEFYARPNNANWLVGSDIGSTLRSMSNPSAYSQPDTYNGTNWYVGSGDNGGVHINSGVANYWFYLLTTGGSGTNDLGNAYTVSGIGMDKAQRIAYRTLNNYLFPTANYANARFYSILSAIDLYGACSPEVVATTNAWYAVGVGNVYDGIVTADFTADVLAACDAPLTVKFTNSSANAGNFIWDFGDGNTSTENSPTHTYTNLGTFSIQLISDAGSCGNDTLVRSNYIDIDSSNPCIYSMPNSGIPANIIPCAGTLYDAGGLNSNYYDNTTSTITIAPENAATVSINFSVFDLETDYDYLYIYDGTSDDAPNLGFYTGNTLPNSGNPIVAQSGAITLKLVSDPFVTGAGFVLTWNCTPISAAPVADFAANVTTTCSGNIQFDDKSTNVPTSWLWNFGDGNTSAEKNPAHQYANNGTYTVSLESANSFGSHTITKTNHISVNRPVAPVAAPTTFCEGETATFTHSSELSWYDSATMDSLLAVGNTFTTPPLNNNIDYYVTKTDISPVQSVGPASTNIGSSGYFGLSTRWLTFDVYQPVRLVSVKVYANGGLNRTIQLRDAQGIVLKDTTLYVNSGESRITLNFDLPIGTGLRLGTTATSELSRNSSGAVFPYTLPGVLSITGTNATAGYYYFFYDWEVQLPDCISQVGTVSATVKPLPQPVVIGENVVCQNDKTYTIQNANPNHTYNWTVIGGSIVNGQGTATITVNWTDAVNDGTIEVIETTP